MANARGKVDVPIDGELRTWVETQAARLPDTGRPGRKGRMAEFIRQVLAAQKAGEAWKPPEVDPSVLRVAEALLALSSADRAVLSALGERLAQAPKGRSPRARARRHRGWDTLRSDHT
jgi:hypothetical protein